MKVKWLKGGGGGARAVTSHNMSSLFPLPAPGGSTGGTLSTSQGDHD